MQRFDEKEFSFKRSNMDDETKRRSQILRLTTLTSIHSNYDKSERLLLTLSNSLKSLLNYYNLRELNTKILSFRQNIFKALRYLLCYFAEKKSTSWWIVSRKRKKPVLRPFMKRWSKDIKCCIITMIGLIFRVCESMQVECLRCKLKPFWSNWFCWLICVLSKFLIIKLTIRFNNNRIYQD